VIGVEVKEDVMTFDFVFSSDERGQEYETQYKEENMRAFSIGFKAKSSVDLWWPWDDEPDIKTIEVTLPDESTMKLDLTKYEHVPYRIFNKWELLEISAVPVPANPEALLMREAEGIIRRAVTMSPQARSFVKTEVKETYGALIELLKELDDKFDGDFTLSGVVPVHKSDIEDVEFILAKARVEIAKWASKDGSGEKDDIDWAKYSNAFAWFDTAEAENHAAYKLLHHTISNEKFVVGWGGLRSAMANLLSGEVEVGEDREKVYEHLAAHYTHLGKTAPELREGYTEEELRALADEPFEVKSDGEAGDEETAEEVPPVEEEERSASGDKTLVEKFALLEKKFDTLLRLIEEDQISLSISLSAIQGALELRQSRPPTQRGEEGAEEVVETIEVVGEVDEDLIRELESVGANAGDPTEE
jgi:hypothetical protein